ncbi:MAG: Ig-like domain-containing protein, partial [Luteimonas sp.]
MTKGKQMNMAKTLKNCSRGLPWVSALLLSTLLAACGGGGGGGGSDGGRDPILGGPGSAALRPTVIAVVPANGATGVPVNNTIITAAFSEPVAPLTGSASFTVTCAAPCVNPIGTVSLDAASRIATFKLATGTSLTPLTLYTATVTGATSIATGLSMASPFVWRFTTGVTPDTTRPRVTFTVPATTIPGPTPGAPINANITATFSEPMAPATINGSSFTL